MLDTRASTSLTETPAAALSGDGSPERATETRETRLSVSRRELLRLLIVPPLFLTAARLRGKERG
jgi:hypothetical protein